MPFTGDIGKLLSRLLQEVGLPERDVFITNVVRCRPINDRAAYATEYKACMEAHAALDVPKDPPKLILLLGLLPLTSILGIKRLQRTGESYSIALCSTVKPWLLIALVRF